jgi:hypothetical protein
MAELQYNLLSKCVFLAMVIGIQVPTLEDIIKVVKDLVSRLAC